MAVYKVPQDVEADDKLLGPLSFRQFIYAMIAAVGCFVAFLLSKIFIGLIIIPMPIILIATILALPLRKDQPMEMYVVAVVRFFLKPRLRKWEPEGRVNLVEIVAPRMMEEQRTNNLNPDEARNRLEHLAQLMDTRGWSARGVLDPALQAIPDVIASDADLSNDIMDVDASVAQSFNSLLAKKDVERQKSTQQKVNEWRHEEPTNNTRPNTVASSSDGSISLDQLITTQQQAPQADVLAKDATATPVHFDPYPSSIHQHVINPVRDDDSTSDDTQAVSTSDKAVTTQVSPDIMRLATESKNLSISTIAHEAHRLENKQDEENNEVVISLR